MNKLGWAASLSLLCALIVSSVSVSAQEPQVLTPRATEKTTAPPIPVQPQATPQLTKEDVEAYFDGFIPIELQRDDIAGAVVLIVKDGKVLFAKG